jgi:hypothetical protein
MAARSDYRDEVGWPQLAGDVGRAARGADVVVTRNYGEAGALELFGRGLPPIASADVTFRYWRPDVRGDRALLVGFAAADAAQVCRTYAVVGRIRMPVANDERGEPIARCTLTGTLARVWPRLVALAGSFGYAGG